MRQSRTSGSVGAAGEQSPVATQPPVLPTPVLPPAAPIPRRKATLRATQCAVRYSGVPIAVLNRSSIRNRHECPSILSDAPRLV